MRLIKMLCLTVVAALTAMAIIGAGSASAVLCKTATSPCTSPWGTPTLVLVSSSAVKFVASVTLLCKLHASLLHEGESAGKLFGKVELLDWTNCTGCTEVTTTTLGTFEDEATGGGNGRLFPKGQVVLMKGCPLGAECTFKSINGTTQYAFTGGTINGTANMTASTEIAVEGFGCSTNGKGKWETEAGSPLVVLLVSDSSGTFTTGSIFQE